MRIALLFAGRIKTFEHCYETFKKYISEPLKEHDIDSFLSHNVINKSDDIETFSKLYNVKSYEETDMNDTSYYEKHVKLHSSKGSSYISFTMHYNIHNSFSIMEKYSIANNIKYDLVIYMRADQHFESPLLLPSTIEDNTVYIPDIYDYTGLNDQFAYGNFEAMKKYCSLYLNIEKYYKELHVGFHTETYVELNVQQQKLNLVRFNLQYLLHSGRK